MFGVLFFGLIMMVVSAAFWYVELKNFVNNIYHIPKKSKFAPIAFLQGIYSFTVNISRLFTYGFYFILDMFITMASISVLGFGDAVSGGILGLAFSNVISALLMFIMWKRNREKDKLINGQGATV
jgi:uncharacterized BrkB/YihY/UPF0761 family membrane protein